MQVHTDVDGLMEMAKIRPVMPLFEGSSINSQPLTMISECSIVPLNVTRRLQQDTLSKVIFTIYYT
jgi:hypothetical protein